MIFKILFKSGRHDYAQAQSKQHLLESYDAEYNDADDIEQVTELSEEEAKAIVIENTDHDIDDPFGEPETFFLHDLIVGDDFSIVASSDY